MNGYSCVLVETDEHFSLPTKKWNRIGNFGNAIGFGRAKLFKSHRVRLLCASLADFTRQHERPKLE